MQRSDRPPKRLARGPELVTLAQDGAEFVSGCRIPFEELEQPIIQAVIVGVQLERIRAQVGDRVVCALSGVVALRGGREPRSTAHPWAAVVMRVAIGDHACERAAPSSH